MKSQKRENGGTRLAQVEEFTTLYLGDMSLSPSLGVEITKKNFF